MNKQNSTAPVGSGALLEGCQRKSCQFNRLTASRLGPSWPELYMPHLGTKHRLFFPLDIPRHRRGTSLPVEGEPARQPGSVCIAELLNAVRYMANAIQSLSCSYRCDVSMTSNK